MTDYRQLLACFDAEFAQADPLVMNLLVAKSIPSRGITESRVRGG